MARKKVKLAWIANDSAQRSTYKKRKQGLMKKINELSTLCGVEACAVVYGPYDPQVPDVWPSPSDAHRVLTQFKSLPEMERNKKMMNQEAFLKERMAKMREQIKKQQRENREFEITQLMNRTLIDGTGQILQNVETKELKDLAWMIDEKMKRIQKRIDSLRSTMESAVQQINGTGIQTTTEMEAAQRQIWGVGNDFANGGMPYADNTP
uniref:MADS-box protein AGL83 n=1 Tax=Aquilegia coerulea TaxID=218851 RepID=K7X7E5_AQUCA|nr:MADS-box protein AGL83 [Aquilegia coerulea]